MILDLFLISVIASYCIEISGGWNGISSKIMKWLCGVEKPFELKPFSCPLCCAFWAQLVYILIAGPSLSLVAVACVFSYATIIYPTVFAVAESVIMWVLNKILDSIN